MKRESEFLLINRPITEVPFKPKIHPPNEYLAQRKAEVMDNSWKKKISYPKWLLKLRMKEASEEEVFHTTLEEIRKAPTVSNLRLAQMLMNDFGKYDKGVKVLKSNITLSLIKEFQKGGSAYTR